MVGFASMQLVPTVPAIIGSQQRGAGVGLKTERGVQ